MRGRDMAPPWTVLGRLTCFPPPPMSPRPPSPEHVECKQSRHLPPLPASLLTSVPSTSRGARDVTVQGTRTSNSR